MTIAPAVVAAVVESDPVTAPEPSAECPPLRHETLMERVETLKSNQGRRATQCLEFS